MSYTLIQQRTGNVCVILTSADTALQKEEKKKATHNIYHD